MLLSKFSPILIFTISGRSMHPVLKHDERVMVVKKRFITIKKGDIVVCNDPRTNMAIVKRVQEVKEKGYFLVGENKSESTDSRQFGWVAKEHIIGKVIGKI